MKTRNSKFQALRPDSLYYTYVNVIRELAKLHQNQMSKNVDQLVQISGPNHSVCTGTFSDARNAGLRSRQKDWISGLHPSGLSTVDNVFVFTEQ